MSLACIILAARDAEAHSHVTPLGDCDADAFKLCVR